MTDNIIHTAHNFRCSHETRTLGEAYPVLKIADDNLKQFEKCLELLRSSDNERVAKTAQEAFEMFGDMRHDLSWASLVSLAEDAANEAMVRPVRRGTHEQARIPASTKEVGAKPK